MRSLIKVLIPRRPRIELWGIPVKISIHSLIPDPVFYSLPSIWKIKQFQVMV